jgi:hypothetical protein
MAESPGNHGKLHIPQLCAIRSLSFPLIALNLLRRSHLPEGVKTKSWEIRMQKTQKAIAIKKLETELKDEKRAEIQRYSIFSSHQTLF